LDFQEIGEMEDRRQRIRDWFDIRKPELPVRLVAAGIFISIFGLLLLRSDQVLVGLVLSGAGACLVAIKGRQYVAARSLYLERPSTDEMVQWLSEDFNKRKEASLLKFGMAATELIRESVAVAGPIPPTETGPDQARCCRSATDDDPAGPCLYSHWKLSVAHFTSGVMMLYRCDYDWREDVVVNEGTEGIGYEHVASVKTDVDSSGEGRFVLSLSNQERIEVAFAGAKLRAVNDRDLRKQAELAVQAIHSAKRNWATTGVRFYATAPGGAAGIQTQPGGSVNFCEKCGFRYEGDEVFCPGCGSRR
jgi:hypothetical protein